MSDDAFMLEIQDSFLQEAADLLAKVEALSLALEKNPESSEIYADLARLAHNFKGSGKAVGFDHISTLGHRLEDFILGIKNRIIEGNPQNLDFLFRCLDKLSSDVALLTSDKSAVLDHTQILSELTARLNKTHIDSNEPMQTRRPKAPEPAQFEPEPSPQPAEVEFAAPSAIEMPPTPTMAAVPAEATAATSAPAAPAKAPAEVLRIQKNKIDYMLEAFGEQVILQSTLEQYKFDMEGNKDLIAKTITQLTKLTFELQNHALSLTMIQMTPTFTKLERAIRDAARMCEKSIEVQLEGTETEVDKTLVDALSDPLTHMVRNAVDHAIEDSETRKAVKKPESGTVKICAKRSGGQLWIEVSDDGKGLDPEQLKKKAVSKNLISAEKAAILSPNEAYRLIFANGFSTKEVVSEVSGRGVGMNVVEEVVKGLKGSIEIESAVGKGTLFRLKLPLSLSIFNGAVIRVNNNKFVVPNSEISEIVKVSPQDQIQVGAHQSAIKIRNEVFRLVDLRLTLPAIRSNMPNNNPKSEEKTDFPLLVTRKFGNCAFIVDEIVGMQQIVQKPLGDEVKLRPEYAAGTILSDGSPGVILNLLPLCKSA